MKEKKHENEDSELTPQELRREIISWVCWLLAAVLITICLREFVLVNAKIPTSSMATQIEPGDRLVGFRLAYLFSEPERGDIVIFEYPVDEEEIFIKRVIGLPGETVEMKDGKIYIDGSTTPLEEDYLPEEWTVENDGYYYEVPEHSYLLLGDNRNVSLDARYWPQEAQNQALLEGVELSDEEAWQYSFVEEDEILGKAIFKYWPSIQTLK
jgi:signal peptidase I